VFVHKREFSVFDGNPGADDFVDALARAVAARHRGAAPEFVVCGVAADVCVRHAVDGLLARGHRVAVAPRRHVGARARAAGRAAGALGGGGVRVVTVAELEADAAPAAGPGVA
jgi:nicotinamidase/pyrazinamidase